MEKRLSAREDLLSEKLVRAVLGNIFYFRKFLCVDRVGERACYRGRMEVTPAVRRNAQRHQVRAFFWLVSVLFVGTPTAAGVASRRFVLLHAPLAAAPGHMRDWRLGAVRVLVHPARLHRTFALSLRFGSSACAGTLRPRAN